MANEIEETQKLTKQKKIRKIIFTYVMSTQALFWLLYLRSIEPVNHGHSHRMNRLARHNSDATEARQLSA